MKTVTTTLEGKSNQHVPQWIEAKVSHYLMNRCFELLTFVTLYGWDVKYAFLKAIDSCPHEKYVAYRKLYAFFVS